MDVNDSNPAISAIGKCIAIGVRNFVICSGARNSSLIAVITSIDNVQVYNHPEERSAAYFALGKSIATGEPVAVVTTSGTATAELFPAVIEAHYQAAPLVMLTADRPVRFRGKGAPQAIVQHDIFGIYAEHDIDDWIARGPLHINVPLEEASPVGLDGCSISLPNPDLVASLTSASDHHTELFQQFLNRPGQCMVLVGCLPLSWRDDVKRFLKRLNVPVLAEATSGLREEFPRCCVPDDVARVLRIGGVPTDRLWRDLEEKPGVEVFSVSPNGLPGLARESSVVTSPCWNALDVPENFNECHYDNSSLDELLCAYPESEPSWVRRLSEYIPEGSLVFLGNSQPVREWNLAATLNSRGLRCFANRGANGIDGCVSTFLGLSSCEKEAWALVGDLTALYDLAGPWIVDQLPHSNRRIVVINNGGGRIFRRLPALQKFNPSQMQLVENAHSFSFKGWADMWGMSYRKVAALEDLRALPDGLLLIELFPSLEQSDDFWHSIKS